jgi:hypothetical protein
MIARFEERLEGWLGAAILIALFCQAALRHAHRAAARRRLRRRHGAY